MGALQSGARWGPSATRRAPGWSCRGCRAPTGPIWPRRVRFISADGALRYGAEVLGELFYRRGLTEQVSLGVNYSRS